MSVLHPQQRAMTAGEWGMLLFLSLLWGGSFFFNGVAVREMPTFSIVAGRVVLAAILLQLVLYMRGDSLPFRRDLWQAFLAMGLLNNVLPFSLIVWGQGHIGSGVASILNATTPLFTVLIAHLATPDEKLTGPRLAGVLLGLAGVAVMIGMDSLKMLGQQLPAQIAVLAASVSYGFAGIFGRRFRQMGISPMQTAAGQVSASSLIMLPLMLLIDRPWLHPLPGPSAIGALIGIASLSTALAYILYFRILSTAGATNLLLVTFLIPVSAIMLGILLLGESLHWQHLLGMGFIGLGFAAIDGRPWNWLSHRYKRNFHSSEPDLR